MAITPERADMPEGLVAFLAFLRKRLQWKIPDAPVFYEYDSEELALPAEVASNVERVMQFPPFEEEQPWGVFLIKLGEVMWWDEACRHIARGFFPNRKNRPGYLPTWWLSHMIFIYTVDYAQYEFCYARGNSYSKAYFSCAGEYNAYKYSDSPYYFMSNLKYPDDPTNSEQWLQDWQNALYNTGASYICSFFEELEDWLESNTTTKELTTMSTNTQINLFKNAFSVLAGYERGVLKPGAVKLVPKVRFVSVNPLNFVNRPGEETFDLMRYTYLEECVWERFNACRFSSEEKKSATKEVISSRIARIDALLRSRLVEEETGERVIKTVVPIRTQDELFNLLRASFDVLANYERAVLIANKSKQVPRVNKIRFVSETVFVSETGTETFSLIRYECLKRCVWARFNAVEFTSPARKAEVKATVSEAIAIIDKYAVAAFLEGESKERVNPALIDSPQLVGL